MKLYKLTLTPDPKLPENAVRFNRHIPIIANSWRQVFELIEARGVAEEEIVDISPQGDVWEAQ